MGGSGGAAPGGGGGSAGTSTLMTYLNSLPLEILDPGEVAAIRYMRQEEKFARDVYLALHGMWGQRVFANIAAAEQQHMDLVLWLVNRYGIVDPIPGEIEGVFEEPAFGILYQFCLSYGSQSIENAMFLGAAIEDLDLFDLQNDLAQSDNSDIDTVYQNLAKGSRNHLRSFSAQLDALSVPYSAIFLSQAEIDAITTSPREVGVVYDENGNPL